MADQKQWSGYYDATRNKPPRPLLVKALEFANATGKVLDLGGGALNDARYLLEKGFEVTVVDKSPLVEKEAEGIASNRLHVYISSFEDFIFPEDEFDLVSGMFALPFTAPQMFDAVFRRLIGSLKKGGIFCGQLFGDRDGWSADTQMTFHTIERARSLFEGMELISFTEDEKDGKTAKGDPKHWHVFHVIARK